MKTNKKLLHISRNDSLRCLQPDSFLKALHQFGEVEVIADGSGLTAEQVAEHVRRCNVYLAGWDSVPLPTSLAGNPGSLEYICGVTGAMKNYVPVELVDAGIPLTNWGDAPAHAVAEAAIMLLLATMKDLHHHVNVIRHGGFYISREGHGGSLYGLSVGVYGFGAIGRKFCELLRPFGAVIRVYDPYIEQLPDGLIRVNSLEELFGTSSAIAIHAALTDETRGAVNAELLRMLPVFGVIVNTARGEIMDQDALFAELQRGRLRAGLDTLVADELPADHPIRQCENVIITSHQAEMLWPGSQKRMERRHEVCLDNLRRWREGRTLRFLMDPLRYRRST